MEEAGPRRFTPSPEQRYKRSKLREAYSNMANKVSRGINPYLNSEKKIDETLLTFIETVAENYQEQLNSIENNENKLNEREGGADLRTSQKYSSFPPRSKVFAHIIGRMLAVIYDEGLTSERGSRAQGIKTFLSKPLSAKTDKSEGIEK